MGHPKVADCGVIGVPTVDGSNELVRWGNNMSDEVQLKMLADKHFNIRAYIAPKDSALLKSQTFVVEIQEWVKEKASKHQQLRGGTFFISILFCVIDNPCCLSPLYFLRVRLTLSFVFRTSKHLTDIIYNLFSSIRLSLSTLRYRYRTP